MTRPYAWYQYFVNTPTPMSAATCACSPSSTQEIANWRRPPRAPARRAAQRRLAAELTTLVHGANTPSSVAAARRCSAAANSRPRRPTLAAALAEVPIDVRLADGARPSSICSWRPACGEPGRRAPRGQRGRRVGEQHEFDDEDWAPEPATSCTAVGSSCAAASGISRAARPALLGGPADRPPRPAAATPY